MTLFWILLGLLGLTAVLICYSACVVSSRENYVPRDYYEKVVSEMAKRNVEAADIVFCKECKWADFYTTAEKEQYCYCLETDRGGRTADDFCSYGERSE